MSGHPVFGSLQHRSGGGYGFVVFGRLAGRSFVGVAENHVGAVEGCRKGRELKVVLRVQKECGRGVFEMVAQDMSQMAIESLGSQMSLRL